ncbi:MAG TPA: hypothetical protein VGX03_29855 [Candidatus Binatia bacterium]|jgi:hypothetical protein|nr:hypothetical protein [Candidatus Binatia bacterium]
MSSKKTTPEADAAERDMAPAKKALDYRRREDFAQFYANNVLLQSSSWDMKLIFGELDQSLGEDVIVQHSAITLPWRQAKVLLYFLQVHLIGHEGQHGRVIIPPGIIPDFPSEPPKELVEKLPFIAQSWKIARQMYEDFLTANPEAAPKHEN